MIKRAFYLFAIAMLASCNNTGNETGTQTTATETKPDSVSAPVTNSTASEFRANLNTASDTIFNLIKAKNFSRLLTFVHPENGIRFSPSAHVNLQKDKVFTTAELEKIMQNDTPITWGAYDGSGEPIQLSFKDYFARFVYDKNCPTAEEITYNIKKQRGNTADNSSETYSEADIAEWFCPGFDAQHNGMDWRSLKLVLEKYNGKYFLVGIIHNGWSI